jgi:hypothetical protein
MADGCLGDAGEPSKAEELGEGLAFVLYGERENEDTTGVFLFFEGVGLCLWVCVKRKDEGRRVERRRKEEEEEEEDREG